MDRILWSQETDAKALDLRSVLLGITASVNSCFCQHLACSSREMRSARCEEDRGACHR